MLKTKKIVVSMLLLFALLFTGLGVSSMLPVKATAEGTVPTVDVSDSLKLNFSDKGGYKQDRSNTDYRFWLEFEGVKMFANNKTAWLVGNYPELHNFITYNGKTLTEINEATDDAGWSYPKDPRNWGGPWSVPLTACIYGFNDSTRILVYVHENYIKDHPVQSIGITKDFYILPKETDAETAGTAYNSSKDVNVTFAYDEEVKSYGVISSSYDEVKPATLSVEQGFPKIGENKLLSFNVIADADCFDFDYNATGGGARMVTRYIKIGDKTIEDIVKNTNDADWVYPNEFPFVHKVDGVDEPWDAFCQPVFVYAHGNKMTIKLHENLVKQFADDISITVLPSVQLTYGKTLYQVQPMEETVFYHKPYTLTLNIDGTPSTKSLSNTEPITLEDPVKTGYTFNGWFEDAEFTTPKSKNNMPSADYELFAKFTINTYDVTISGECVETTVQKVEYNGKATAPEAPVKENTVDKVFTFDGWYNGEVKFDFNTPITEDITLTAKFTETARKYKVTFDNGVTAQEVEYNGKATAPEAPAKDGYEFVGWYNGETEYNFDTAVTGDVNLTAKYKKVEKGCGGTIDGTMITLTIALALAGTVIFIKRRKDN